MEDEFTEFRSAESIAEIDLLELNSSGSNFQQQHKSKVVYSSFSFETDEEPKRAASKKKMFVFPYDLDLNSNSLLEAASIENNSKPSAWSLMENIEGLDKLASGLVENGRLSQSLKCKKHAETVGEIMRIKEIKRIAADREDYDTAIQYRNLLVQLEKQLCSADEIEEWLKEYKDTTLADLENYVKQNLGEEVAAKFKEKFVLPEIKKSSDIETAQNIMASAQQFIMVKTILKDQISTFSSQCQIILQKISEELSKAITILFKLKPHFPELIEDNELKTYMKALPEVYNIGKKLSKIINFCNLTKTFEKILCEISHNWDECKEFINTSNTEFKNEYGENICGICLFSSKGLVMLCSSFFHVSCINFWINRISTDPPKLITVNF